MTKAKIQARILKGFRDYLPDYAVPRERLINKLSGVFASFGYQPIDTPALEYAEILLGKGSQETDKQLYRFTDQGMRDVALRFDLTIPLARFFAQHAHELGTPFRRYHIAPVWRAEKPQRGRFREFMQCDFDILGTKSLLADVEIISIINRCFNELELSHQIRINNRSLLADSLLAFGVNENSLQASMRALDKLDKIGSEGVTAELESEAGLSSSICNSILSFLELAAGKLPPHDLFKEVKSMVPGGSGLGGLSELEFICRQLDSIGMSQDLYAVDISIARGLDYYTGTVFETFLNDLPEIGSVCSGGRYDNLTALYSKQAVPGVGASVGLDRLLAGLEEMGLLADKSAGKRVLVTYLDEGTESSCLLLADFLRSSGLAVELYPQKSKLALQLKYANRKGIRYVVIAGEDECSAGLFKVKDMQSGEQRDALEKKELLSSIAANDAKQDI